MTTKQKNKLATTNATAISMSARLRKHLRGRRDAPRMCNVRIVDKLDHSKVNILIPITAQQIHLYAYLVQSWLYQGFHIGELP